VEQSTGSTVLYGKVKIFFMLLNMSEIHQRSINIWCIVMRNKDIGPFFLEDSAVTGDTFL